MIKNLIESFINLIYPFRCIGCGKKIVDKTNISLCSQCWLSIKRNYPPFCLRCGRHLEETDSSICKECKNKIYYFDRAFSACIYEGLIVELIHQFKYNGKDFLGRTLANILIDFINTYKIPIKEFNLIIAVPLHPRKLRDREYNQSQILAEAIAKEFRLNFIKDAVYKIKDTVSQTELSCQERLKNVTDSFRLNPKIDIKNKSILIVDDLLTTGATASELARVLKLAGCKNTVVLTLAS
ncbi:MAG: ComF family protein [Candidatus Omnitrophica bacterium]|nr:ComF family protein [Candidatus Omnitrophota bacterium]MCM8799240.1 ComF family protein [Candidatus Omnitrophota bacterium]